MAMQVEVITQAEKAARTKGEKKPHARRRPSVAFIVVFILFVLYSITLIYPYLWAIMTTFKYDWDYNNNRVWFPQEWTFSNYSDAFVELSAAGRSLITMLFNSAWYSVGGTLIAIASSTVSAYVVAKYRFPGRGIVYGIAIVTMTLPIIGALPSQYTMYGKLGILDTPFYLIAMANGLGFNFMILYGFFKSLPWSYVEAAYLDGAGHFRTFISVMLPQAASVIASLGIVAFISTWNDYMNPILFLESYPTMSMGLYVYQQETLQQGIDIPVLFAGVIMSTVPVLTLFVIFQNSIMSLTLGGGLKG